MKGGEDLMADNQGKGWHGDPKGHAQAGSQYSGHTGDREEHKVTGKKGGKAQRKQNNSGNFVDHIKENVEKVAKKVGQD